jgi:lipoprotein-anchoring transpeptidase ErfK/SrfK
LSLKSLSVTWVAAIAAMAAAFSPAKAERDHNSCASVKTNFIGGAYSYKLNPRFKRKEVAYSSLEKPGTIIIETRKHYLYLVLASGKALRYGIGVGRSGLGKAQSGSAARRSGPIGACTRKCWNATPTCPNSWKADPAIRWERGPFILALLSTASMEPHSHGPSAKPSHRAASVSPTRM